MADHGDDHQPPAVITRAGLDGLLRALARRGFKVIGPTVRDQAILYEEISSTADLPEGWTDEQEGGTYRLKRRDDGALFGFNVGPNSWKSHLFPPNLTLWKSHRSADGAIHFDEEPLERPRYAFVGVRSCDLAAIGVQDRVFTGDTFTDPDYEARRGEAFIVAVNCGEAGNTCFCVSMETGPRAKRGFDLALTELLDGPEHRFLVEVGSERGAELLAEIEARAAEEADDRAAEDVSDRCASQMGRELDTEGIKELLYRNMEHPRWEEVADRCLSCGNCTLVCPTCFCSTVEDVTDLAGEEAERVREWDSCFTLDHSFIHGGSVRNSPSSRYRQWMTHKLATWIDQFGTSGCVGCGRCITWCPVAIDITEEAAAIRATGPRHGEDRVKSIAELVGEAPTFKGMDRADLELVAGCGQNEVFEAGDYLLREGEAANKFFVVRRGHVALETFVPERGALTIETIESGDLLGWSWLVSPYRVDFDARAVEPTGVTSFDAACLRGKFDDNPRLGYELMKRFIPVIVERLQATRLRLLDVYGHVATG